MSHVAAGHEAWLVNAVVDSFTESHSIRCLEILAGMNEPHDKVWMIFVCDAVLLLTVLTLNVHSLDMRVCVLATSRPR